MLVPSIACGFRLGCSDIEPKPAFQERAADKGEKKVDNLTTSLISGILATFILSACATQGESSAPNVTDFVDPGFPVMSYAPECPAGGEWSIAIHGGAGVITRESFTAEQEADYRSDLTDVLSMGGSLLEDGTSALDAAQHMVIIMEDNPKFNAGHGAVFSAAGINEMDASIMDGRDRNAGAVSSVTTVRNPIRAARAVLDNSRHVLLSGKGAEDFAAAQDLPLVPNRYFGTDRRREQLEKKMSTQGAALDTDETRFGTVGAVVRDGCGNLAAATSTGGLTAKEFGRVGDTPIIGAGTYADNRYCAVSATGTGEYFIRGGISKLVCDRIRYTGADLQSAMDFAIFTELTELGGDGGIIGMDRNGVVGFSFNTEGMYRGSYMSGGQPNVGIFGKEDK